MGEIMIKINITNDGKIILTAVELVTNLSSCQTTELIEKLNGAIKDSRDYKDATKKIEYLNKKYDEPEIDLPIENDIKTILLEDQKF